MTKLRTDLSEQDREAIAELCVECATDPVAWAERAYDWGHGELANHDGPRGWQADLLGAVRDHLQNPDTHYKPLQLAVSSGHGIGKSAAVGMLINWAMSTCVDCKVVVTANTESQLRTKTSPEVAKWFKLSVTADAFTSNIMSIKSSDQGHDESWVCDFLTWSENNTEGFAGLHNAGKRIVVVYDEASGISDKVWSVTEGALTDMDTEIIWVAFGNPTQATGRFRECFRKYKHRWVTRQIDSRTVEGTNKEFLQSLVDDYGEDSDIVKVRVRGLFPSMSQRQFISEVDVDSAYGKTLRREDFEFAATIIGVDPSWDGDDEFSIVLRQGLYSRVLSTFPKNDDDMRSASLIAQFEDEHHADAVFIDFGYGQGIYSRGKEMGRNWQLVKFGEKARKPGYALMRDQIWGDLKQWLKDGGALPADPVLRDELLSPEAYVRTNGDIKLESKDEMKRRGLTSPNRADALACTFAYPVIKRTPLDIARERSGCNDRRNYDPLSTYGKLR